MPHPLVLQLRFMRGEFRRALAGISDADARRRLMPVNCMSWTVGHLTWQEQKYWLLGRRLGMLLPHIHEGFCCGAPASTPSLGSMWKAWEAITAADDPWLDALTTETLAAPREVALDGHRHRFTYGMLMLRMIYHYWYHLGETVAIRQMLGHTDLPGFVGDIDRLVPYRPE
jgi:hypothetical protein